MSSQRRKIREAVVTLLLGKTPCANNVFNFRMTNLFEAELPSILVYTKNEPVRIYTEAPREYEKMLNLVVEIVADASAGDVDLEATLDEIADDVEYWMHQDHTKGELCADTTLKSTEISILNPGDKLIGSAALIFEMPYYAEAVRDPSDLDVMARADVKYRVFGPDDAASGKAEDLISPATGGP